MTGSSTPENDLSTTLARQADEFSRRGGGVIELDQVVARAGEIRRGRRMRATMVMAAVVLAVAVPVGVTVIGSDSTKPKQVQPAKDPDTSAIVVEGLKDGAAPKNGYAAGEVVAGVDTDYELDSGSARELARMNGGYLVASDVGEGELRARFVGPQAEDSTKMWPITGSFAVSPGGNVGAFAEPDGTVRIVQDADDGTPGARVFTLGRVPGESFQVVGISGEDCSPEGTCSVYVSSENGGPEGYTPETWVAGVGADPVRLETTVIYAMDDIAPDGSRLGRISISETGACYGVETDDGRQLWKDCERGARRFSPDGKLVLGGSNFLDGLGDSQLTVLDAATGEPRLELRTQIETTIWKAAWEDDEHILAIVVEKNRWAMIRFGLDGTREYAIAPVTAGYADDALAPFVLAER